MHRMYRTGPNDLVSCGAYDLKDFSNLLSIASSRYNNHNMPEYTFNLNLVNMVLQKLWSGFRIPLATCYGMSPEIYRSG